MEHVRVTLADDAAFDLAVHGPDALRDGGDLRLVTKDRATTDGNPAVALTFSVELPDGSVRRAQTVTTVRNLLAAAALLRGRYGDL